MYCHLVPKHDCSCLSVRLHRPETYRGLKHTGTVVTPNSEGEMMNTYGESATIWGAVIKMACGAQPRPIACVYARNVRECPGIGMRSHISTPMHLCREMKSSCTNDNLMFIEAQAQAGLPSYWCLVAAKRWRHSQGPKAAPDFQALPSNGHRSTHHGWPSSADSIAPELGPS